MGMFNPDLGYDAEHRSQVEVFKELDWMAKHWK
jgi:hypothetical protein